MSRVHRPILWICNYLFFLPLCCSTVPPGGIGVAENLVTPPLQSTCRQERWSRKSTESFSDNKTMMNHVALRTLKPQFLNLEPVGPKIHWWRHLILSEAWSIRNFQLCKNYFTKLVSFNLRGIKSKSKNLANLNPAPRSQNVPKSVFDLVLACLKKIDTRMRLWKKRSA